MDNTEPDPLIDVVKSGYEAFACGDIAKVISLLALDVTWYAPDELPSGGTFEGPEAVAGFFASLPGLYDELRVEPDRFIRDGRTVVVEGHHRGKIQGTAFEVRFAHFWVLAGGQVVKFREYTDTGKLLPLFTTVPS